VNNKSAQKVKVNFCRNLFINSLINIVILISWFTFFSLEMLIEFIVILKQQKENLICRIFYWVDHFISFGD
jgi:hypothetical protein